MKTFLRGIRAERVADGGEERVILRGLVLGKVVLVKENKKYYLCRIAGTKTQTYGEIKKHSSEFALLEKGKKGLLVSYETFEYERVTKKKVLADVVEIFEG